MTIDLTVTVRVTGVPDNYTIALQLHKNGPDGQSTAHPVPTPMRRFLAGASPDDKTSALKLVSQLQPYLPQVKQLLQTDSTPLSGHEFSQFVLGTGATLRALGVKTILPKGACCIPRCYVPTSLRPHVPAFPRSRAPAFPP